MTFGVIPFLPFLCFHRLRQPESGQHPLTCPAEALPFRNILKEYYLRAAPGWHDRMTQCIVNGRMRLCLVMTYDILQSLDATQLAWCERSLT